MKLEEQILSRTLLIFFILKKAYFVKNRKCFKPIPPRQFPNLFPLGGVRHVSHPVKLDTKIYLYQNFSLSGLRVSIADFGFEGPGFDSR